MAVEVPDFEDVVGITELEMDMVKNKGPEAWAEYKEDAFKKMNERVPRMGTYLKSRINEELREDQDHLFEFAYVIFDATELRLPDWMSKRKEPLYSKL
ncbi:hypothetical protein HY440_00280 [Candidatus Microgenomates bacterium]|nr:hypothetical protein [Candidatus Microgenomates bacterium]